MTLIISLLHPNGILMGADTKLTTTYTPVNDKFIPNGEQTIRYSKSTKFFEIPGVACVTCWGDFTRLHGKIKILFANYGDFQNVDDLSEKVYQFLLKEIDPFVDEELGFHIGGYMDSKKPKLYHVFYGKDVGLGLDPNTNLQQVKKHDHSDFLALYNGQNHIAHEIINSILILEKTLGIIKWITEYDISKAISLIENIMVYASKNDLTIGGNINIVTIDKQNKMNIYTKEQDLTIPNPITFYEEKNDSSHILPSGIHPCDSTASVKRII